MMDANDGKNQYRTLAHRISQAVDLEEVAMAILHDQKLTEEERGILENAVRFARALKVVNLPAEEL